MSLSRQTLKRLPEIKQGFINGSSYEEIAVACSVHHRTIERDVQSWVNTGLFEVWIKEEFLRLHPKAIKKDLLKAYDNICKLVGKMITRKAEIRSREERVNMKLDVKRLEVVELFETYDKAVAAAVRRNIESLTKDTNQQQMDTTHPNAKTS